MVAERIELFRFKPPSAIAPFTSYTWTGGSSGGYRLLIPGGEYFTVECDLLGVWTARFFTTQGCREVACCDSARDAVVAADALLEKERPKQRKIVARHAPWREREPSSSQLGVLRRYEVPTPQGLSRGQASWMIAHLRQP